MLSDPTASATVKGNDKADLIEKGQVISECDFNRSWTEDKVLGHIRQAFLEKLEGRRQIIYFISMLKYLAVLSSPTGIPRGR